MGRAHQERGRRRAALALAAALVAVVLPLLAAPDPVDAAIDWDEGVASAADVEGRLVTVWVTGLWGSGFSPPNLLHAARQLCAGCGWDVGVHPIGLGWFGAPSLSLAGDGRLEVIGWVVPPGSDPSAAEIQVLPETCSGCGWTGAGLPPQDLFHPLARQLPVDPPRSRRLGIAAATNPDGRRELFTTAADGQMWHTWEW